MNLFFLFLKSFTADVETLAVVADELMVKRKSGTTEMLGCIYNDVAVREGVYRKSAVYSFYRGNECQPATKHKENKEEYCIDLPRLPHIC